MDEDEFMLEIKTKSKNKLGENEIVKIPVDDIDEIEHVQGTLQFFIHYQARIGDGENVSSIKGIFNKIKRTATQGNPNEKEEKSEQFESKFVK